MHSVQAETSQKFYNAKGQITGTATTNSNDWMGHSPGSATRR
jgi:hypothetical protein